jgi:exportin-2 (importin alpha re-exporter)
MSLLRHIINVASTGAMRVIITARQSLIPSYSAVLERLVAIVGETSKNPSNPKFNQYNFESISALVRYACTELICIIHSCLWLIKNAITSYVCAGQPEALSSFENALFPPIQTMLSSDVAGTLSFNHVCSGARHG